VSKKVRPFRKKIYLQSMALQHLARPRAEEDDPLLTVADVAHRLRASRGLVYELVRSGELRSLLIHRIRRIRASALDQFMRESGSDYWGKKAGSLPPAEKEKVEGRLAKHRREHNHG
jgi:excisionase family DNA binding protein